MGLWGLYGLCSISPVYFLCRGYTTGWYGMNNYMAYVVFVCYVFYVTAYYVVVWLLWCYVVYTAYV